MRLEIELFGATFQNPVLLGAGTCGFCQEPVDAVDLDALGGFVTRSVTLEPRAGNPAPQVAEFTGGMLNSVGLANPGLESMRRNKLPWIREHVRRARVFVSLAGHTVADYCALVEVGTATFAEPRAGERIVRGLDGAVASPAEARAIKASLKPPFLVVTPGIRPSGAARGDQKRVAAPAEAVAAGADWLVAGRPVTQADDPAAALSSLLAEIP